MSDIEFKNGFLCGLVGTGLGIGGGSGGDESGPSDKLPSLDRMTVVNIKGYDKVTTKLKKTSYTTVLSSGFAYVPQKGYVMIGGYMLIDLTSDEWWLGAEADLRVTVDGKCLYEGDLEEYFDYDTTFEQAKTFQYQNSFEIAAKRRNMSDEMQLSLEDTMIVGIN